LVIYVYKNKLVELSNSEVPEDSLDLMWGGISSSEDESMIVGIVDIQVSLKDQSEIQANNEIYPGRRPKGLKPQ